ncbi:MAG: hypothetical protein LRY62_03705 [Alphaproteobacteria bacterium]|nr:hypothetical protein [Alphaproteobacteria bacterium]
MTKTHHPDGPLAVYEAKLQGGDITPDPAQAKAALLLDAIYGKLLKVAEKTGRRNWFKFGQSKKDFIKGGVFLGAASGAARRC